MSKSDRWFEKTKKKKFILFKEKQQLSVEKLILVYLFLHFVSKYLHSSNHFRMMQFQYSNES